jgi:hypothetical protein
MPVLSSDVWLRRISVCLGVKGRGVPIRRALRRTGARLHDALANAQSKWIGDHRWPAMPISGHDARQEAAD